MLAIAPVSMLCDLITFGVLCLVLHADMLQFRSGWFIGSLVTQILMIFSVRTHRHLFRSRPHPIVTGLALGTSALTLALPFLPIGAWFEFVALPIAPYYGFLIIAVTGFLITIEVVKRAFYARMMGRESKTEAA